jgi:chemotaxis protein methyltransferase CheR
MPDREMASQDLRHIVDLVRNDAAIVLDGREYLIEARLRDVCIEQEISGISDLVAELRSNPGCRLQTLVVEAMTTNETLFFRDVKPFETLKMQLIPALMESRKVNRTIRIWCAGCSTGQEPYSIAMTLHDAFPELRDWTVSILATDISKEMVERASQGTFNQYEVTRGLPPRLLAKYFNRSGDSWRICDELRGAIEFRELNLIRPWPAMPSVDIVFLRNVLIYFDFETKQEILRKVREVLRTSGYLMLGGSESTCGYDANYELAANVTSSCYQVTAG